MKNGHSEDDTFHTLVELKVLREQFYFYYESVTLKLIEVKRKVSAKRVLWFSFISFKCLRRKSCTKSLDQHRRHFCRNPSKNLERVFLQSLKRKGLEVTFCQHDFKRNVQEHHFAYFYEVIINSYPNFIGSKF